jgi:predicted nucleic acid-binding protein
MKAVFDTHFFISSIESKDDKFRKWARHTLETLERNGNTGIIPSIVILEFYRIEMKDSGKQTADARTSAILKLNLKTVNLDTKIAIEAAKLRCIYTELPTGDAIIAATAIATSCDYVLTDDKHLRQIKEIRTRWL